MAADVTFRWYPERLNSALATAYRASIQTAAQDAEANAPSPEAGVRVVGDGLEATGKGPIFEQGAAPHVIAPTNGFLFLKGLNRFVSTPVDHPGSPPKRYIAPAAQRWALGGFQAVARTVLAIRGF
jgi:hypothetical protein